MLNYKKLPDKIKDKQCEWYKRRSFKASMKIVVCFTLSALKNNGKKIFKLGIYILEIQK